MNENVRKAVESIKDTREDFMAPEGCVTVFDDDLDTLLEWALERIAEEDSYEEGLTCDLKEGDTVQLQVRIGAFSAGDRGEVKQISLGDEYPFWVQFGGAAPLGFKRMELKKVRG